LTLRRQNMKTVGVAERIRLETAVERWPLRAPFRISGYQWEAADLFVVRLERDGCVGWGEASGVYYKGETANSIQQQVEAIRTILEGGVNNERLQSLLPAGGARNAVDCALWDLESKTSGRPVWRQAGVEPPRALVTLFTCGIDEPDTMAAAACAYKDAQAIKVKLAGDSKDADRVRAIRDARTDVWLSVDANQGLTRTSFEQLLPVFVDARVALIEQPFPVGHEALLDGVRCPIPVAADESAQTSSDVPKLAGRFNVVNVKLDKCGGLTEGLAMARAAQSQGLDCMVGNMMGTSLSMAPAFIVGQICKVVDLDGPLFLQKDRSNPAQYSGGLISFPGSLWGYP
jgi:L-Ala-D/L-Glu epimerase